MNTPKIIKVEKKPKICPSCKGKVVKILYGEPTDEAMEESENKKIIISGFGAGLSWAAASIDLSDTHICELIEY